MTIQGSEEWLAERRLGVTSTDIPAILGVSPWTSEGDVARAKAGVVEEHDEETQRRFRVGRALEAVIRAEDELEHGIKLRRVHRFIVDPDRPLLRTSLDFERVGERVIVEAKSSASRDWDAGLPEYVEAQVRWQMGVARYPRAHVAALRFGQTLLCFDIDHDPATFDQLVLIAEDFWRRYETGGPFAETTASSRRAWPNDDGTVIAADPETEEAIVDLLATRARLAADAEREEALRAAIQTRMGPASRLLYPGGAITWRRTKEITETAWKDLAADALGQLDPVTIDGLVARHTTTKPGIRRFVVREDAAVKETE